MALWFLVLDIEAIRVDKELHDVRNQITILKKDSMLQVSKGVIIWSTKLFFFNIYKSWMIKQSISNWPRAFSTSMVCVFFAELLHSAGPDPVVGPLAAVIWWIREEELEWMIVVFQANFIFTFHRPVVFSVCVFLASFSDDKY